jgi:hypothetical protein
LPKVTADITIEESYSSAQEDVDIIYNDVIIPDLLVAEAGLPATYTGSNIGRATKGAAKSLLGKVYLTTKDFVKAESKLLEVTTMGYSLLPNYADLFNYTKNEHHSEYIFDIEYIQVAGRPFANYFFQIQGFCNTCLISKVGGT